MGLPGQLCRVFCGDAVEGAVGGGSGMMDMEAEATMAQQLSLGRTRALKGLEHLSSYFWQLPLQCAAVTFKRLLGPQTPVHKHSTH